MLEHFPYFECAYIKEKLQFFVKKNMAIKAAKLKELNQGVNSLKLNDFQNYKKSSSFFNLKDNINELNRNLNLNYK